MTDRAPSTPPLAPPDRLLRLRDLIELTALSRATIYRKMKVGQFPQPIRIGSTRRWPATEIAGFIEVRKLVRGKRVA